MVTWDQGICAVRWMNRYFSSVEARDINLSLACRKRVMLAWSGADNEDNRGSATSALLVSGCKDLVSIYHWVIGITPMLFRDDILAWRAKPTF